MQLAPVRTAAPAQLPVSVDEAKRHLRVDDTDNDATIAALIQTATDYFDGYSGILGRALITQTWAIDVGGPNYNWDYRAFSLCRHIRLPLRPVQSISSVTYWDGSNVSQTYPSPSYSLLSDSRGSYLYLGNGYSWPGVYARPDALRVSFIAGYGDNSTDVPAPIRHSILLMVSHLYENRQSVYVDTSRGIAIELPQGIAALTAPYRISS